MSARTTLTPVQMKDIFAAVAEARRVQDLESIPADLDTPIRTTPPLVMETQSLIEEIRTQCEVTRPTAQKYHQASLEDPESLLCRVWVDERGAIIRIWNYALVKWQTFNDADLVDWDPADCQPYVSLSGYLMPYQPYATRSHDKWEPRSMLVRRDLLVAALTEYHDAYLAARRAWTQSRRDSMRRLDEAYPGLRKALREVLGEGTDDPLGYVSFDESTDDLAKPEFILHMSILRSEGLARLAKALGLEVQG